MESRYNTFESEMQEIVKMEKKNYYRKIPETLVQSYDCIMLKD